jgi:glycosyltransferase involved in cell wall biosynthesis
MSNTPKVSVLIPCYNYAHFLDEAILSVLNQTYTDYEIVIVDNNSTDNTDEVVQKYLNDGKVFYYKNSTNIGAIANFNKCLTYAKGQYIKYLMADDKFHPRLLEIFVGIMDEHPNVSLITSYWEMFDRKTRKWILPYSHLQHGQTIINDVLNEAKGNWIGAPTTVMFRKDKAPAGNFSFKYTALTDLYMWLQILSVGDCYIVPEILSYFRVHEASWTNAKRVEHWMDDYRFYKNIFSNNEFKVKESGIKLDKQIKAKAERCALGMYQLIPKLLEKRNRKTFSEGFKIAYSENVLLASLFNVLKQRINPRKKQAHVQQKKIQHIEL